MFSNNNWWESSSIERNDADGWTQNRVCMSISFYFQIKFLYVEKKNYIVHPFGNEYESLLIGWGHVEMTYYCIHRP